MKTMKEILSVYSMIRYVQGIQDSHLEDAQYVPHEITAYWADEGMPHWVQEAEKITGKEYSKQLKAIGQYGKGYDKTPAIDFDKIKEDLETLLLS